MALLVADVYETAGAARRWGERLAAASGQTQARWQLLSVISDGDWTVPGAADRLGTSRQAVQRITNELVADGLVELEDNPRHRRSPFVKPTPAGRHALEAINAQAERRHRAIAAELGDVDVAALRRTLRRFTDVVKRDVETDDPSS